MKRGAMISVIVVNWNQAPYLERCLDSLRPARGGEVLEVIVVDNASTDQSAGMVRARFPWVRLIVNATNLGFARANNGGLEESKGDPICLLNNDAEVIGDALGIMAAYLRDHPGVGAVGPQLLNSDGSLQPSGRSFPKIGDVLAQSTGLYRLWRRDFFKEPGRDYSRIAPVDEISGACIMIRREVYRKVGGLDPRYFLYYEDVDWCWRIKQSGWEIHYLPGARVMHHWGRSSTQDLWRVRLEGRKSLLRFYREHVSRLDFQLLRAGLLAVDLAVVVKGILQVPFQAGNGRKRVRSGLHLIKLTLGSGAR
ncbi:MAG: glycosyltransferase family 2 protein [Acidobacteria bacterium]|nr:glycosyltransferase family 2 protein [Acidobacteriota bacterium]